MNNEDVEGPWDLGEEGGDVYAEDFYDSETIYFAVKSSVRENGFYDDYCK